MADRADDATEVAVVLVHGIGSQRQAGPLSEWTGALLGWLGAWRGPGGSWQDAETNNNEWPRRVRLIQSDPGSSSTPASAELLLARGPGRCRVHVVEAHWADDVVPPSFSALTVWVIRLLGLAVTYHIAAMLGSAVQRNREWWRHGNVAARAWALARWAGTGVGFLLAPLVTATLTPVVALLLLALLVLGMLGSLVPSFGGVALSVHRVINATLGDTLFVLSNEVQRGFIIAKARRTLATALSAVGEGGRVVVLAHSQGAWVAHQTLLESSLPHRTIELITFGQGLMKIERLRDQSMTRRIMLLVGPILTPLLVWIALSVPDAVSIENLQQGLLLLAIALIPLVLVGLAFVLLMTFAYHLCDELEKAAHDTSRSAFGGTQRSDFQWLRTAIVRIGPWLGAGMIYATYTWLGNTRYAQWSEKLESAVAEPTKTLLGLSLIAFGYTAYALYNIRHAPLQMPSAVRHWHDLYASTDPICNGPLPGAQRVSVPELAELREHSDSSTPLFTTTRVYNYRDPIRDHIGYWRNREQFVAAVAHLILPAYWVSRKVLTQGDQLRRRAGHACLFVRLLVLAFVPWAGAQLQYYSLQDLPAWIAVPDLTLPAGTVGWIMAVAGAVVVSITAEALLGWALRSGYDPGMSQDRAEYLAETGAYEESRDDSGDTSSDMIGDETSNETSNETDNEYSNEAGNLIESKTADEYRPPSVTRKST